MINKVILVGNLGKDPDVRSVGTASVAQFTMATTEWYMDKENVMQSKTEWHNIVAWRHLADKAQKKLKKGSKVYIEGKITSRSYEKEGVKHYITEIVANVLMPLDKETSGIPLPPEPENQYVPTTEKQATQPQVSTTTTEGIEDDLPF